MADAAPAISVEQRTRVLASLELLQKEHDRIINEMLVARRQISKRARELVQPLIEARRAIIAGEASPAETDAAAASTKTATLAGFTIDKAEAKPEEEAEAAEEPEAAAAAAGAEDSVKVPFSEFWMTVLMQHPMWEDMIEEVDEEALKHLTDISVAMHEDWCGYRMTWTFSENPFFSNKALTKDIYFTGEVDNSSDIGIKLVKGCKINWRAGKQITVSKPVKAPKGKGKGKGRGKAKAPKPEPVESIFRFFERTVDPSKIGEMDLDEEELEELQELASMDVHATDVIREAIAPRAIKWFLGEETADDDDDEAFMAEDSDEEGEEDEEEGDDTEEDKAALRDALSNAFKSADGAGADGASNPFAGGNPFAASGEGAGAGANPFAAGGEGGAAAEGGEKAECKQQ
ncbi:hypothetical protein FNF27_07269 [Cafeteria roenbergensis]|uniref:Nucleosome assembly protein n=1 Tax=Cafeteria roenbergensis TaxID=33653 RepID=A0A5A8CDP1_CAFRO|nr:hypothetical protein FNF29_05420 [Cafeteria roenbergensis]KAA0164451.1 hypothetical protein FNF31_02375 [Cafeteria roenbergensis]KAA0167707.1 hypothetical protein FNF27_07269 [Cafeteria roenbergensis]KAA0170071.1 hypothetical protein FNF28_01680 [Cafeteria roenbergensis]|eukprot:KAA0150180.1 hypothetical protein FNF29_05420 [Cafeteria roenbergensis]